MRAKNREDYVSAWRSHVNAMTPLALAADIPHDEWLHWRDHWYAQIEKAADRQEFDSE